MAIDKAMNMNAPDLKSDEIAAYKERGLGVMVINRPQALNALKWEMIQQINHQLDAWEHDDDVKAIAFYGAGERAFCAGGDIKDVHKIGADKAHQYFSDEYGMNAKLYHYKKPLVGFMNGITMGGGYGVAAYCDYRLVSANTRFAMPEVGIGFFPDIGSVYFMNNIPNEIGTYLCVTGAIIDAADVLYTGIGTQSIEFQDIETCIVELGRVLQNLSGDHDAHGLIKTVLKKYVDESLSEKNAVLKPHEKHIKACFAHDQIHKVLQDLETKAGEWGAGVADDIRAKSPLSVKLALANLRFAAGQDIDTILERDLRLSDFFMAGNEFKEGVRALLVDKDKQPKWGAKTLDDVSDEAIADLLSGEIDVQQAAKILG